MDPLKNYRIGLFFRYRTRMLLRWMSWPMGCPAYQKKWPIEFFQNQRPESAIVSIPKNVTFPLWSFQEMHFVRRLSFYHASWMMWCLSSWKLARIAQWFRESEEKINFSLEKSSNWEKRFHFTRQKIIPWASNIFRRLKATETTLIFSSISLHFKYVWVMFGISKSAITAKWWPATAVSLTCDDANILFECGPSFTVIFFCTKSDVFMRSQSSRNRVWISSTLKIRMIANDTTSFGVPIMIWALNFLPRRTLKGKIHNQIKINLIKF